MLFASEGRRRQYFLFAAMLEKERRSVPNSNSRSHSYFPGLTGSYYSNTGLCPETRDRARAQTQFKKESVCFPKWV